MSHLTALEVKTKSPNFRDRRNDRGKNSNVALADSLFPPPFARNALDWPDKRV
jgi:hypothetical protein